jgi:hypothetical protein
MKILFFCPDYYGIYKIIEKGIQENIDCELTTIVFKDYQYKNVFQKFKNFFYKTFFKKNLKKLWASKQNISSIKPSDQFDIVFFICPDLLLNEELKFITSRAKKSIVYYWDSFKNIPRYERTLPFFDVKYSFEKKDVEKHNLTFLTNFYYKTLQEIENEYDVFFIGALDERIDEILKLTNRLSNYRKKIIVQNRNKSKLEKYQNTGIELIENPITFEEAQTFFERSKVIIDIQKTIQNGLTFRVFDAMSHRKKLITTNKDIINYDFYNPNNIFVWDDSIEKIPETFFELPYQELPIQIFEKYSIKTWVKTIFEQN